MPSGILTFLTDFGTRDAYVAAMKGVALQRAPGLRIVDISHEVPPQDVHRASYLLAEAAPWFPAGSVHVVVVDPGVGTDRRSIVAVLDDQLVVTPDNGTVSRLYASSQRRTCFELTHLDLGLSPRSTTFHGRDLYAPAGALLACGGIEPEDCGAPLEPRLHESPDPTRQDRLSTGQVITVDHFGNLVTNLSEAHLPDDPGEVKVQVGEKTIVPLVHTYGDVTTGTVVALLGSSGLIEVACNQGSAASTLGLGIGCPVFVRW